MKSKKLSILVLFLFLFSNCAGALKVEELMIDLPKFISEEIVVTALKMIKPRIESPWDTVVLNPSDFKDANTLYDALREVSGVDLRAGGGLGSAATARLRGSSSQQVLLLLDGRRINSPLLGMFDLNDILLNNIDRIEIVKAPLSCLYGSDAIGGVINLISKKEDNRFSVATGSFNTYKLDWGYSRTSLNYTKSGGFRENGDYSATQIGQGGRWEVGGGQLNARVDYYSAEKGVPGVPNIVSDPYSASTPSDRQMDRNLFLDLSYDIGANRMNTQSRVYYNSLNSRSHIYDFFATSFVDSQYDTYQTGLELNQTLTISKRSTLLWGLEARQDRGVSFYAGDHSLDNYALLGQAQMSYRNTNIVVGSRLDKNSQFGYAMTPRIGVSYYPSHDLIVRASAGNGFKAPTLNDLYWNDPVWQMYGNAQLKPEKSRTYELGFEYQNIKFNYFTSSINDLILWNWDLATNITQAENIGAVDARGFELDWTYRLTEMLSAFANYTWSKSQDALLAMDTPYSPENKYNVGLKVADNAKLTFSYVGRRFVDSGKTVSLPEYTLANLWVGRELGRFNASLAIDNLFDQVYYEAVGYHPATFARMNYPMPGRTIKVTFGGEI